MSSYTSNNETSGQFTCQVILQIMKQWTIYLTSYTSNNERSGQFTCQVILQIMKEVDNLLVKLYFK